MKQFRKRVKRRRNNPYQLTGAELELKKDWRLVDGDLVWVVDCILTNDGEAVVKRVHGDVSDPALDRLAHAVLSASPETEVVEIWGFHEKV